MARGREEKKEGEKAFVKNKGYSPYPTCKLPITAHVVRLNVRMYCSTKHVSAKLWRGGRPQKERVRGRKERERAQVGMSD